MVQICLNGYWWYIYDFPTTVQKKGYYVIYVIRYIFEKKTRILKKDTSYTCSIKNIINGFIIVE
jgi:hypothetical protein